MRVSSLISLFLLIVSALTFGAHYSLHGVLNTTYIIVAFFLVLNLLICFWELCLFFCIDHIKSRFDKHKEEFSDNKSEAVMNFMNSKVTLKNVASMKFWSETWSTYALFDGSYADKRTYGFAIDIGNGMSTLIPSLIVHVGISVQFLPANILGIIALLLFYQMTYGTVLYWISFIVNKRYRLITFNENMMYIVGTNAPWFIFGVVGIYSSIRMILDNNFSVFGI